MVSGLGCGVSHVRRRKAQGTIQGSQTHPTETALSSGCDRQHERDERDGTCVRATALEHGPS